MLFPSVFRESLFDDFFDSPRRERYFDQNMSDLMRTDVKDTEDAYELTMNLPGIKKEDVKAELKDGYLTINAVSNSQKEDKDSEGRYIRQERFSGACSRSFFVGKDVKQEDIKAMFEDGTLKLTIPKSKKEIEENNRNYIQIDG